ncbi:hypothetical protein ccbrp13_04470 [Ktedonobacteria bacterium brp13]|nr:hypothetical protein ccbrp13_04470 [Ktedonobacteria bacterium brp13]
MAEQDEQFEQLWYTWSTVGINGGVGFRVRAASPALTDVHGKRFQELDKHLRYDLPRGTDAYQATPENTPCCLALIDTPGATRERILVHKVHAGKDIYGRPGSFFCHLLADFSRNISPAEVIELYRSPIWQLKDPGEQVSTELGLMSYDDFEFCPPEDRILTQVQAYIPAMLYAFLARKEGQKIYIVAASSDEVAALIWALTRGLPVNLQRTLTFSTYEADLRSSSAVIVGSCLSATREMPRGFPSTFESAEGFAINCLQPAPALSNQPIADYAYYAAPYLANNDDSARLGEFLTVAEKYISPDVAAFLRFAAASAMKIAAGQTSLAMIEEILGNEDLSALYLDNEALQYQLIEYARQDFTLWQRIVDRGHIQNLQRSSDIRIKSALQQLAKTLVKEATAHLSLRQGVYTLAQADPWMNMLYMLETVAPPKYKEHAEPWLQLLVSHYTYFQSIQQNAYALFTQQQHMFLLDRWVHMADQIELKHLSPWHPRTWQNLAYILDQQINMRKGWVKNSPGQPLFPDTWMCKFIRATLISMYSRNVSFPEKMMTNIEYFFPLFSDATSELWLKPRDRTSAIAFIADIITQRFDSYKMRELVVRLLNTTPIEPTASLTFDDQTLPGDIEALLHEAQLGKWDAYSLVKKTYPVLLKIPDCNTVKEVIHQFLDVVSPRPIEEDDQGDQKILRDLYRARKEFRDDHLIQQIEDHYWIRIGGSQLGWSDLDTVDKLLTRVLSAQKRQKLLDAPTPTIYSLLVRTAADKEDRLRCAIRVGQKFVDQEKGDLLCALATNYAHSDVLDEKQICPYLIVACDKDVKSNRRIVTNIFNEFLHSDQQACSAVIGYMYYRQNLIDEDAQVLRVLPALIRLCKELLQQYDDTLTVNSEKLQLRPKNVDAPLHDHSMLTPVSPRTDVQLSDVQAASPVEVQPPITYAVPMETQPSASTLSATTDAASAGGGHENNESFWSYHDASVTQMPDAAVQSSMAMLDVLRLFKEPYLHARLKSIEKEIEAEDKKNEKEHSGQASAFRQALSDEQSQLSYCLIEKDPDSVNLEIIYDNVTILDKEVVDEKLNQRPELAKYFHEDTVNHYCQQALDDKKLLLDMKKIIKKGITPDTKVLFTTNITITPEQNMQIRQTIEVFVKLRLFILYLNECCGQSFYEWCNTSK